jgi:hypothetical protein
VFCPYLLDFRDKPAKEKTEDRRCKFFARCEESVGYAKNKRKRGSMENLGLIYVETWSGTSNCVGEK